MTRLFWVFSCVVTCAASGQVVFSNFGPNDTVGGPGVGIGQLPFGGPFNYAGIAFTPQGRNYVLSTLELPMALRSGPNELDVFLMGDANGLPLGTLESYHVSNALHTGSPAIVRINSLRHPTLMAGARYWVIAAGGSPSTFAEWTQNSINETGLNVGGQSLQALVRNTDANVREALRVTANNITSVSPSSVTAGGPQFTLTVNGSGFAPGLAVVWNGTILATTLVSSAQLTAVVPAALTSVSGSVALSISGVGTATLTIAPAPQPTLASLTPSSATAGAPQLTLTVNGSNFLSWARVRWNTTDLSTTFQGATQLTAIVPASLVSNGGAATITVANAADAVSNALSFSVGCSYTISAAGAASPSGPASAIIPATGGTGSVTVAASPGCAWTATSSVAWVTITLGATGAGNGVVTYSVAANAGLGRTGALNIASQTFSISQLAAQVTISQVTSAVNFQPGLASGAWIAVQGANLSTTSRTWSEADFAGDRLPRLLDGVTVNINGKPAYVYYVSPTQLNVLAPEDAALGPVSVDVVNALGKTTATGQKQAVSPAFFALSGLSPRYAIATFPDGTFAARPELVPGTPVRPAKPGDVIALYATGLGPTNPAYPDGQIIRQAARLQNQVSVTVGGVPAVVDFAGIIVAGVYQINIRVPDVPDGDAIVTLQVQGFTPDDHALVPVKR